MARRGKRTRMQVKLEKGWKGDKEWKKLAWEKRRQRKGNKMRKK